MLEQLVRAGVGRVVLVDRDVVEATNLQRQTLFGEADVGRAKADAAAARLAAIDSCVVLDARPTDVHAGNVEALAEGCDVLIDATDNAATRYLLNDLAVKTKRPFVYGGCVATEGRALAIVPGNACLRCVFETPPAAGELPTCDTAGVLGPAAAVAAAWQAGLALKLLLGHAVPTRLLIFDLWQQAARTVAVEPNPACPCCGERRFEFLDTPRVDAAELCGRDTVQLRPGEPFDLEALAVRLASAGKVRRLGSILRFEPGGGRRLSLFADGRVLVQGAGGLTAARTLAARYLG